MLDLADRMAGRKKIKYCTKYLIAKMEQNPNTPFLLGNSVGN
jgi:hypothetical protein